MKYTTYVGLDVHVETISAAVAFEDGNKPLELGKMPHNDDAVCKLVKKIGTKDVLYCYEAPAPAVIISIVF